MTNPTEHPLEPLDSKTLDMNGLCAAYLTSKNQAAREEIFNAMYERGLIMGRTRFRYLSKVLYEPDALDIALEKTMLKVRSRLDADLSPSGSKKPITPETFDSYFLRSLHNHLVNVHTEEGYLSRYRERSIDKLENNHPQDFLRYPEFDEPTPNAQELRDHFIAALRKGFISRMTNSTQTMQNFCDGIKTFLYTVKGMPYAEIAQIMGCKDTALVRKRAERGRDLMKEMAPEFEALLKNAPLREKVRLRRNLNVDEFIQEITRSEEPTKTFAGRNGRYHLRTGRAI